MREKTSEEAEILHVKNIILASGSPRRRELMAQAGFTFDIQTSKADEAYDPSMHPEQVAPYLACLKAQAVANELPCEQRSSSIIVGADTIVALGMSIYGKPHDASDARRILKELSGKTHQVITGVCVIANEETQTFAEVTNVTFKQLSDEEIAAYVAGGEPMDKAGAYGIQGEGGKLIDHIDGDFDNVVGLPIARLAPILEKLLG